MLAGANNILPISSVIYIYIYIYIYRYDTKCEVLIKCSWHTTNQKEMNNIIILREARSFSLFKPSV